MATSLRELQRVFEFDDRDLRANQKGKLSPAQLDDFQLQAKRQLMAMLVVPALVVMWIMMSLDFWVALPGVFLISLLCTGIAALHREQRRAIANKPIEKISGKLQKTVFNHQFGAAQCVIAVGDEQLPIDRDLFDQLTEGKFHIYMFNSQILSMEPMRGKSSNAKKTATTKSSRTATTKKRATTTTKRTATASKSSTKQSKRRKPTPRNQSSLRKTSSSKDKMAKATGKVQAKPLVRERKTS